MTPDRAVPAEGEAYAQARSIVAERDALKAIIAKLREEKSALFRLLTVWDDRGIWCETQPPEDQFQLRRMWLCLGEEEAMEAMIAAAGPEPAPGARTASR